ncbi:hypothetical protein CY34DRAFT_444264 [Suillus luteus UH-Slu-Lm8-n1]|uniref:Uncharacterized protein n=1 Tax=Suillus luteus UH-Slu-Lm8-n1 TaxID=930992 RepID=A0A0D0A7W9_9AGAM|nr:hypothetical protein CY34DRAFT_444264 [Suillus luteus UH-Slu-Lm8-n1]
MNSIAPRCDSWSRGAVWYLCYKARRVARRTRMLRPEFGISKINRPVTRGTSGRACSGACSRGCGGRRIACPSRSRAFCTKVGCTRWDRGIYMAVCSIIHAGVRIASLCGDLVGITSRIVCACKSSNCHLVISTARRVHRSRSHTFRWDVFFGGRSDSRDWVRRVRGCSTRASSRFARRVAPSSFGGGYDCR